MTSVARCLPRNFATSAGFSKQHDTASFDGIFGGSLRLCPIICHLDPVSQLIGIRLSINSNKAISLPS